MTDLPRIAAVTPQADAIVVIVWTDATTDTVDLSGWIARGGAALSPLTVPKIFNRVAVADYGLAVRWGDEDDDLAIDSVHLKALAEHQRRLSGDTARAWIARWQDVMGLSNNEAADLLGVSLSTWHNYKNGTSVPSLAVQIACRAMERDPVIFEAHYKPRRAGRPTMN